MTKSSESKDRGPGGSLGSSPPTPTIFQKRQIRPLRFQLPRVSRGDETRPPPPTSNRPMNRFSAVRAFLLCCLLYGTAACVSAQPNPPAPPTEPGPKLSPAQVVSAQLAALKNNDDDDTGIRITFRFASPGNKAQTGPIERFIEMLKNPAYQPMINYKSDHREPIEVDGSVAKQVVTLVSSSGKRTRYLFVLSKQKQPPCRGCWMTDAVMRLDPMSGPVRVASDTEAARHASANLSRSAVRLTAASPRPGA